MTAAGPVPLGVGGRLPAAFTAVTGSSFTDFLRGRRARPAARPPTALPTHGTVDAPHGTTIVAATFDGGVVMAGDRRATMGNVIAQRDIEKVFPADEYSCVGIAGTAGLAIELVRLFQVELEHYEKIEGTTLSLDGKANRLAAMIRDNLGAGHAGSGRRAAVRRLRPVAVSQGRIFSYDVTGGRYEEHSFHSVGSGSLFARGALKKLYRDDLDAERRRRGLRRGAVRRRRRRLGHRWPRPHPRASSRSSPSSTADGYRRLPDDEIGGCRRDHGRRTQRPPRRTHRPPHLTSPRRGLTPTVSMPFYVSPEQVIKDKADYARKGIARGRSVVVVQYADGILFVAENPSRALHKVSEIYDRIAFAAVGKYNEFENLRVAGVRLADLRGYSYDRRDVTGRGLANAYAQTLGTIFTETPKPYEVEIVVAEVGRRGRTTTSSTG